MRNCNCDQKTPCPKNAAYGYMKGNCRHLAVETEGRLQFVLAEIRLLHRELSEEEFKCVMDHIGTALATTRRESVQVAA